MSLNENAEKQTFYYEIHFFSEGRQQIFKIKNSTVFIIQSPAPWEMPSCCVPFIDF